MDDEWLSRAQLCERLGIAGTKLDNWMHKYGSSKTLMNLIFCIGDQVVEADRTSLRVPRPLGSRPVWVFRLLPPGTEKPPLPFKSAGRTDLRMELERSQREVARLTDQVEILIKVLSMRT